MHDLSKLRLLAEELRRLQRSSPTTREGWEAWMSATLVFADQVDSNLEEIPLPIQIMHYVHDADLRIKDPVYRQAQEELISSTIIELERGVVPASRGVSISFRPSTVVVVTVLLVAVVIYFIAW